MLEAVKVDFHASAPATTDVTIAEADGLGRTLLTLTNVNTDGTYYPRHPLHDTDGVEGSGITPFVVEGRITVAVAGCNALDPAVTVTLMVIENADVR